MLYLALGAAALAAYLWFSRRGLVLQRRQWRVLTAALALAAFTGAAFIGVRGGWGSAIVLGVIGLWLAASARKVEGAAPSPPPSAPMSDHEARQVLGIGADAGADEIQAAYARLMRRAHPDAGGSPGLAAQLNAARDRLLRK